MPNPLTSTALFESHHLMYTLPHSGCKPGFRRPSTVHLSITVMTGNSTNEISPVNTSATKNATRRRW